MHAAGIRSGETSPARPPSRPDSWEVGGRERPGEARLHAALGVAYAGLGRKEEALREGREAIAQIPIELDALGGAWQLQHLA